MVFQNQKLETLRQSIAAKLETLPAEKVQSLQKGMETSAEDLMGYQKVQSQAFALGRIPFDMAQDIYQSIGEGLGRYAKLDLASQIVVTQVVGEIVQKGLHR